MTSRWMVLPLVLVTATPGLVHAQCCGDCNGDRAVTVDELVTAVNNALRVCDAGAATRVCFPLSTGQETSYTPGDDGDLRTGRAHRYRDNGDGTVSDLSMGLMWAKQGPGKGCLNCADDTYGWNAATTEWIDRFNGRVGHCALREEVDCHADDDCPPTPEPFPPDFCIFPDPFAGYRDWRLPNVRELLSIVEYGKREPAVDPIFSSKCGGSCDETTCSCTRKTATYWTSTTLNRNRGSAWLVDFELGESRVSPKSSARRVRAVRE